MNKVAVKPNVEQQTVEMTQEEYLNMRQVAIQKGIHFTQSLNKNGNILFTSSSVFLALCGFIDF